MIELKIKCEQCRISLLDKPVYIAEGCEEYVKAIFDLCPDWQSMTDVVAKFRNNKTGKVYPVEISDSRCMVPAQAIAHPQMDVALFGTDGTVHLTTSILQLPILPSDLGDGVEPSPEPSVFDAIMATARDARRAATEAADSAKKAQEANAATIAVGEVSTGEAGTEASVANVGTEQDAVLNFIIPKGDKGDGVPDVGTAGQFLRKTSDGEEWHTLTAEDAGAAPSTHVHTLESLGAAAADHKHSASDLTSGTLAVDRLPTVPVSKGGTGATDSKGATYNLLSGCKMEDLTATTPEGNVKLYMRPYSSEAGNGAIFAATLASLKVWMRKRLDPAGTIKAYAGATVPEGYLLCNGQAVSRTDYAALFAAIGTTYGSGDGETTFNVPNLYARFPLGGGGGNYQLGMTGGEAEHTLTTSEMPAHTHTLNGGNKVAGGTSSFSVANDKAATSSTGISGVVRQTGTISNPTTSGSVGGGAAHNNMPPYTVVAYIISTGL